MDGTSGDEPDIDKSELWRRLKAAQAAYEKADKEARYLRDYRSKADKWHAMVSKIAKLEEENRGLRKRLDLAQNKVEAQRELVKMAKEMIAALKADARQPRR